MEREPKITITKLQAAKRQVTAAIRMWFAEDDPVSIHLLAYSSHEVVHRLYRVKGHENLLFDAQSIKEEYRDEFCVALKAAANFFKHAKRKGEDANATFEFDPNLNELFLFESVHGLRMIGEKMDFEWFALQTWCYIHLHHMMPEGAFKEMIPVEHVEVMRTIQRKEFMGALKEGVYRQGAAHLFTNL